MFKFDLRKDKEVTGRLEITVCKVKDQADKKTVHSKITGDGYPESNWIAFVNRLSERCEELGISGVAAPS